MQSTRRAGDGTRLIAVARVTIPAWSTIGYGVTVRLTSMPGPRHTGEAWRAEGNEQG